MCPILRLSLEKQELYQIALLTSTQLLRVASSAPHTSSVWPSPSFALLLSYLRPSSFLTWTTAWAPHGSPFLQCHLLTSILFTTSREDFLTCMPDRSETCTWWMQMKMSLPSSYVWLALWEWAFIEAGPTADLFLSTCPRTPVTQPRKRWAANTLLSKQHTEACIFLYKQCHQPWLHSTVARKIQFNTAVCMVYLPWKPVWNPFTFIFF